MNNNVFAKIPEISDGYILDTSREWVAILVPQKRRNYYPNPEFGYNTYTLPSGYDYTSSNATITMVLSDATGIRPTIGNQMLKVARTAAGAFGFYLDPSTGPATHVDFTGHAPDFYHMSFDAYTFPNSVYTLSAAVGATVIYSRRIIGNGKWTRYTMSVPGTGVTRLTFLADAAPTNATFFVDRLQLEATRTDEDAWAAYPSTFISGNLQGYLAADSGYGWESQPNNSFSNRYADNSHGGIEVNLRDLGFFTTAIIGLGMAPYDQASTPISEGGGLYQRSVIKPRQFSLAGMISGANLESIERNRKQLIRYLNTRRTATPQALTLIFHQYTYDGQDASRILRIPAVFEGGLEGAITNLNQERMGLTFRQFIPYIFEEFEDSAYAESTKALSLAAGYSKLFGIDRDQSVWAYDHTTRSSGTRALSGAVWAAAWGPDGKLYLGGEFTDAAGIANTAYICRWNPGTQTFEALSATVPNASVRALCFVGDILYIGGQFTNLGGASGDYFTRYIVSTGAYSVPLAGLTVTGDVYTLQPMINSSNFLAIGGAFTNIGGDATKSYIIFYSVTSGASYAPGTTTPNGAVRSILIYPNQVTITYPTLYVGGDFTALGGTGGDRIAKLPYNGIGSSVWTPLTTVGANGSVFSIAMAPNGTLTAAGAFTSIGGLTVDRIANWNGQVWNSLGVGPDAAIRQIAYDRDGVLYLTGTFSRLSDNTQFLISGAAVYRGGAFTSVPFVGDASGGVFTSGYLCFYDPTVEKVLINVLNPFGSGVVGATLYPTYAMIDCDSDTEYVEYILNPGSTIRLFRIVNITTNTEIIFDDFLQISAYGFRLRLTPYSITFTDYYGMYDFSPYILPSSLKKFKLAKGLNKVCILTDETTNNNLYIFWKNSFISIDQGVD